jgi:glycosyltransferase involved in cell wall biosynthesis
VWQNAVLDPAMLSAGSMTDQQFDRLVALKRTGFEQSAVVQLATEAERARHARDFPDLADRFHAVPFFVPDAAAIPLDVLERKLDCSETLKCLFVGHEARRKGLDRVFQALLRLGAEARKRVQLTVVSKLTDGHIAIQPPPGVRMLPTMPHWQVMQLMRDSDVFVMPSRFESYGLVFLEAMSQGTIPVVPDWEVQRELVDQGAAGVVTSGSAEHLASVLSQLMGDRDLRRRLSLAAHSRFVKEFEPRVVAQRFASCMSRARP